MTGGTALTGELVLTGGGTAFEAFAGTFGGTWPALGPFTPNGAFPSLNRFDCSALIFPPCCGAGEGAGVVDAFDLGNGSNLTGEGAPFAPAFAFEGGPAPKKLLSEE